MALDETGGENADISLKLLIKSCFGGNNFRKDFLNSVVVMLASFLLLDTYINVIKTNTIFALYQFCRK